MNIRLVPQVSDFKAMSFVPVIRDRIEDITSDNLRALLEDDQVKWLKALSIVLLSMSQLAKVQVEGMEDASKPLS